MPHQTVTTNRHVVLLGETHEIVSTAETERTLRGLQHFHLHLVLTHHHVKLLASGITIALQALISSQCHTNALLILISIVAQGIVVCGIIDTIVIEGTRRTLRFVRIIGIIRSSHVVERHEAGGKL